MTTKIHYHKLVRDNIPAELEKLGKTFEYHKVDPTSEAFAFYARTKLVEEIKEYLANPSVDELSDILACVYALIPVEERKGQSFWAHSIQKSMVKGKFKEGYVLDWVEEEEEENV